MHWLVAQQNARKHNLPQINFIRSDWFTGIAIESRFDLIISNPPYIAANDPHLQQGDVRFEPDTALVSGIDGLDDIRHLLTHAKHFLVSGGRLMLEHGYDQADAVTLLMAKAGYEAIKCEQDLSGNDRISYGHYTG